jgi:hypothetical protein
MSAVVLITGASTGFGRDAAERLAPIFDKLLKPADTACLAGYGTTADYADRVLGVFQAAISALDAPGSEEVAEAFVRLTEMAPSQRPFRTVVSAPIQQLLDPYNATAAGLRPIVAQIFNVPELAGAEGPAAAAG